MSIGRHASSAVLVTLFAAAGCVSQGDFDKLQSEKNQEITSLQSSRSALEQQVGTLESQRASLEKQKDSLTKEKDSLTQQVAELEAQRARLQASEKQVEERYDKLRADLSEEVKKGQQIGRASCRERV